MVKKMRPARNAIIVCSGLGTRGGVQYWDPRRRGSSPTVRSGADDALHGRPDGAPPPTRGPLAGRSPFPVSYRCRALMAYRYSVVRLQRDRERFRKRTAARIAQGLHPKCGRRPRAAERTLCEICADKRNKASRARDARSWAAG